MSLGHILHFTEITRLAQAAWDKTKDKSDPVWNDCDPAHRQKFLAVAQAVVESGHAVNDFEHAVKKLAQDAEARREAIEAAHAENPTAHADELPLIAARAGSGLDTVVDRGARIPANPSPFLEPPTSTGMLEMPVHVGAGEAIPAYVPPAQPEKAETAPVEAAPVVDAPTETAKPKRSSKKSSKKPKKEK